MHEIYPQEIQVYQKSAIAYLQAILEDFQIYKSPAVVHRSLLTVVEAQGRIVELAEQVNMDPQVFSKMISNEDTPLIEALGTVLKALGCNSQSNL